MNENEKMNAYFAFIEPKSGPKLIEFLKKRDRRDVTVETRARDVTVCFVNDRAASDVANYANDRYTTTVVDFYVDICYAFNLLPNKFTSILSSDDELVVLQLCLAEINRKVNGVFDVQLVSEVISAKKRIAAKRLNRGSERGEKNEDRDRLLMDEYEKYLERCNCIDFTQVFILVRDFNYDRITEHFNNFVLFDLPFDAIQQEMMEFLLKKRTLFNVTHETPLDASFSDAVDDFSEFKIEKCELSDVTTRYDQTPLKSSSSSVAQLHIERMITSYLRLLFNTRDEIALAVALSNMVNGFSHEAFTALKRMSKANSLSMYQNALSYVLKVKLGGKSYAPDSDCPVMKHFAELSTFTSLMNKIQSVIEEELNSKIAFQKILRVVKNHLTKTSSEKMKKETLESATNAIERMSLLAVDRQLNRLHWKTRSKFQEEKGVVVGENTVLALRQLLNMQATKPSFQQSTNVLTDCFSSQNSPMRFPSLLSQFKSPLEGSPSDPKPLKGRLQNREKKELKSTRKSIDSIKTPPKVKTTDKKLVDILMPNKENTPVCSSEVNRPLKRRLTDVSSFDSKRSKKGKLDKKPLPKGQQLMTRFFRT